MKKFTLFATLIALFCWQNVFAQDLLKSYTKNNTTGSSWFGKTITNVGDINNDGYDDIAASTIQINEARGRVYIYFGGTDTSTEPDLIIDGEMRGAWFGESISAAGDFNNDGYDDFIVGSPRYSDINSGRAYIYFGGADPDNIADVVISGVASSKYLGSTVSGIGDFNNDGYSDVAVAEKATNGNIYIYYGAEKPDGLSDLTIAGVIPRQYSSSISTAGDFNNDGIDDLIIGLSKTSGSEGMALVYYGAETPDSDVDIQVMGGSNHLLGLSVSGGGDFNDDDIDDIAIGVPGYNSNKGAVYVLYGSNSPDGVKDVVLEGVEAGSKFGYYLDFVGDFNKDNVDDILIGEYTVSLSSYLFYGSSSPDTDHGLKFLDIADNNAYGMSISAAGDVDNDGFSDIIIGVSQANTNRGEVYLFKGGAVPDNTKDVTYIGEVTHNGFGDKTAIIGDINGDGVDDFAIAAFASNSVAKVHVYLGSEDPTETFTISGEGYGNLGIVVSGVGDVNNDGYDDFIVGSNDKALLFLGSSTPDNIVDKIFEPEGSGYPVSGVGDVNNDGYDDFMIGAYSAKGGPNSNINFVGKSYLYLGGNDINNLTVVVFEGENGNDRFGFSISAAGDVNGDGYNDILVGALMANSNRGKAYVFYGGETVDKIPDITYSGTDSYFSMDVSSAGDVNGDGYDDIMVSELYKTVDMKGDVYIYYGGETPDNTVDVTIRGLDKNRLGYSICALGDINNDDYDDVAISIPVTNDTKGLVAIYYGAESMDAVADINMIGEENDTYLGMSLSAGGDVNGDGFPNLIIGAPRYNCYNGKVFVYDFKYKQNQTITFNKINLKAITEKTFTLDAVSSSGLPIEYTSSNTNVATISGNTVTIVGLGKTIITAKQIGNDSYNAAVEVSQELIIAKETQKINFTLSIDIEFGAESFDLEATSSSGLPITYTSSNTNVIAISGVRVTVVGAGETIITARQEGNDLYESSETEQRVVVDKSDQTITFNALGGKTIGDEPFDLSATASSGLDIQYSSSDEKVATISGNTVTIVGTGITTITASQAGDNNYNAAADIQQALTIFSTSSIKDAESAGIKLYPNPVSDILNIESEKYIDVVQILNVESRLLRTVEVNGFNKSIDISDLNRGVYFIKIKSENNYYVIRVVKR
ncbi:MAG: FG-GAP-like repeat-containing protein [Bacteroidales bacterium]|jgi:hypothetical protein|nr:FG-GAP-like repeat-containing protein [Bacteroidales bacterium]